MKESTRRIIRDYGGTILAAILIAVFIRTFVIEAYRIPSLAMNPTLIPGDVLFVTKWPYSVEKLKKLKVPLPAPDVPTPKRGEVVLFSDVNHPSGHGPDFIKRVIGLPGEEISIRQGKLILNGKKIPLKPSHPNETLKAEPSCELETLPEGPSYEVCFGPSPLVDFGPTQIPAGSVFVIGDHRVGTKDHSTQGWGIVPQESIHGKAAWIWLSIDNSSQGSADHSWFPQFRFNRMLRSIR